MAYIKRTIIDLKRSYDKLHKIYKSILFQGLLYNIMFFLNSFMMGRIGEYEISAIGMGMQFLWISQAIVQSSGAAVGLLVSRNWGKGDSYRIPEQLVSSIIVATFKFTLIALLVFWQTDRIVSFYTQNPMIADRLRTFLMISIWELIFSGIAMVYESVFQNTNKNKIVSRVYLMELIVNIGLVFLLVELISMGIAGVAVASLLTKLLKFMYLFINYELGYAIRKKQIWKQISQILRVATPILIESFLWNIGSMIIVHSIGRLSVSEVTVYSVFVSTLYVLIVPVEAYARTIKVYLGQLFGKSNEIARLEIKNLIRLNQVAIFLVIIATILYFFNVEHFYRSIEGDTSNLFIQLLPLMLIYIIFKCQNELVSNGLLQVGLDNTFKCIFECIVIATTYLLLLVLNEDIFSIFLVLVIIEIIRFVVLSVRAYGGKWLKKASFLD